MKKLLLLILLVFQLGLLRATNYYVSNSGNDNSSGLTEGTAWETLGKVSSSSFQGGDSILFERGDTFTGTVIISSSGESGSPIVYAAYGTGNKPIFNGFTTLSGWTDEGNSIYSKVVASEGNVTNMVLVNGVNTARGRIPNPGTWWTYESHVDHVSITDTQLTGTPDWSGAQAVIRKNLWTLDKATISAHVGSVFTITEENPSFNPTDSYGYFIQNDLKTLDTTNEWYYNGSTFYIHGNPSGKTIKITTTNEFFRDSAKHFITIKNLSFVGSNSHCIHNMFGHDFVVSNCSFQYMGMSGVYIDVTSTGATTTVENSTFDTSNNWALYMVGGGTTCQIRNNTITNIGLIHGSATGVTNSASNNYDAITVQGVNSLVESNNLTNIGHSGITMRTSTGMIARFNYIRNFGLTRYDAGGIYLWDIPGAKIHNNIVDGSNMVSEGINGNTALGLIGIYIDEQTESCTVFNNTATNVHSFGYMYLNSNTGTLRNNTAYNNGVQFEFAYAWEYGFNVTGMDIKKNKFVSRTAAQPVLYYKNDTHPLNEWGVADSNYYARPMDDNLSIKTFDNPYDGVIRSLADWQTLTGQDAHSKKSPFTTVSVTDTRLEYNATTEPVLIDLGQNYRDIANSDHTFITLQPFTSMVLFRHDPYATSEGRKNVSYHKKRVVYHKKALKY